MSTRAVYGFKASDEWRASPVTFWVYVHCDGYPTGAADKFNRVLQSKNVWKLPRFEADEFAAGFVAINKTDGGGVRLTTGPDAHGDTEYAYLIEQRDKVLFVTAYSDGQPSEAAKFFDGPLTEFIVKAEELEAAA